MRVNDKIEFGGGLHGVVVHVMLNGDWVLEFDGQYSVMTGEEAMYCHKGEEDVWHKTIVEAIEAVE